MTSRHDIREEGSDSLLTVRVVPKASRNALLGFHAGAIRVAVTAPPEKGKANAAVVVTLAKALGIAKSRLSIEGGPTARTKVVRVEGIRAAELARRLAPSL